MSSDTTYCTFEELISSIDEELGSICNVLRDLISKLHQNHIEVVWKNQNIVSYGVGPKKMSEHYVYIGIYKKHVNLGFYHGVSLDDPNGLLEGTGKRLRHVKIKSISEAKNPEIKALIAEAIAEREASRL
jgi:hypothetical protein